MNISVYNFDEVVNCYFHKREITNYQKSYLAFYSSFFDGISTDPRSFLIPLDDHMAHRGDAVFEAFKSVNRKIHLLDRHLDRLFRSAENIALKIPFDRREITEIAIATARAAQADDLMFRLFVSRGPGGFAANPFEPPSAQLYLVALKSVGLSEEKFQKGVSCGWSNIPQKDPRWALTKSCNYLPNVMMKKESVERGLDFTIALDSDQSVAESATENVIIIDQKNCLRIPRLSHILSGTMMLRLFELIRSKRSQYEIKDCIEGLISPEDLTSAQEVLIVSTTVDVLAVTQFENNPIGDGKVGRFAKLFRDLLIQDQTNGELTTCY
jgi:branched-chain amino acid aminotransferase